jgi:type IV pilus assembly protein PilA
MERERGFTLLEMMVVVAIIAILAAILIPNFTHARAQAATSACMANLKSVATQISTALQPGTAAF